MLEQLYQRTIHQIDDFFLDCWAVRERAMAFTYLTPPSQLNSNARGPIAEQTVCDFETRKFTLSKLRSHFIGDLMSAVTEFRYVHRKTIKRQICHADLEDVAGIVYLTLPEHCQGGTVFFRHKITGDYWAHPERRDLYHFDDPNEWEETWRVPMRFNRLICYPGRLFHAIDTPYFGDNIQNARLTLNLFMNLNDRAPLDCQFHEFENRALI